MPNLPYTKQKLDHFILGLNAIHAALWYLLVYRQITPCAIHNNDGHGWYVFNGNNARRA